MYRFIDVTTPICHRYPLHLYDFLLLCPSSPLSLDFLRFFSSRVGCTVMAIDSGYRCVILFQKGFFLPRPSLHCCLDTYKRPIVMYRHGLDLSSPFPMRCERAKKRKTKQNKKAKTSKMPVHNEINCLWCGRSRACSLLCDPHDLHEHRLLLDIEGGRRRLVHHAIFHLERYQRRVS